MLEDVFSRGKVFSNISKVRISSQIFVAEILLDLERQAAAAAKIQGDLKEPYDSKKSKTVAARKMKILGFCWLVLASFLAYAILKSSKTKLSRESNIKSNQPEWTDHLAALLWIPAPENSDAKWLSSSSNDIFRCTPMFKNHQHQSPKHNTATLPKFNSWNLKMMDFPSSESTTVFLLVSSFKMNHVKLRGGYNYSRINQPFW